MLLGAIEPTRQITIAGHRLPRRTLEAMTRSASPPATSHFRNGSRCARHWPCSPAGTASATRGAVAEALEAFGIAHLADRSACTLDGQRTLVGIVKATLHQPELLVLDEPTASLDPDVAERARRGLLDFCAYERRGAARDEPRHAGGRDAHRAGDLRRTRLGGRDDTPPRRGAYGYADLDVFLALAPSTDGEPMSRRRIRM